MKFFFPLIIILLSNFSYSQDEIILLNGKVLEADVPSLNTEEGFITYQLRKNDKVIERTLDKERIFAIVYEDGTENVIYQKDTTVGNYFSVDEMRMYVYGSQDAMNNYKAPLYTIVGVTYGAGLTVLLAPSVFVFLVPFSYVVLAGIPGVKVKEAFIRNKKALGSPAYMLGFKKTAKSKKILNALKGSTIGFLTGLGAYFAYQEITKEKE